MGRTTRLASNLIAAFTWGFTAVWLAMLCLFTWLLVRDGAPDGWSSGPAWAVIGLFWLGGVGLARFALSKPCTFVTVARSGRVRFTWRYPHRSDVADFDPGEIAPPEIVESTDDEGSPYFHARIVLPDGRGFDLAEGHDRRRCEAAIKRFRAKLGPRAG